jgi:hypothetical protein
VKSSGKKQSVAVGLEMRKLPPGTILLSAEVGTVIVAIVMLLLTNTK